MSGGTLTVNQEKRLRAARNEVKREQLRDTPEDLVLYMKLARLYGEFRAMKNRNDKDAQDLRRGLLAQMDEVWKELNT